ncbi:type II secretion system F family protein [archaeon]|nr:type II secretion system F family protein [archaeon]NCP98521.1 type II secretion system F family protein [archaeon]
MDSKKLELLKSDLEKNKSKKDDLDVDLDAVQNIVKKMKEKDKNITSESLSEGHLKELREVISQGRLSQFDVDAENKLAANTEGTLEKSAAKYYKPFKKLVDSVVLYILKNSLGKKISYYLTSANYKRTLVQHLVLSTIFSLLIASFLSFLLLIIFVATMPLWTVSILFIWPILFLVFVFILSYVIPMQKAKSRGVYIDIELPFALRHIATELQAGIGLYKVLQSVAANDYGVLSEEMNRTILEIENGTDTKTALRHSALRSQSKNYNIALFHIVRTLNTGGNLASTINSVADTVSFDLLESTKTFGEKMNFFGIIFIFMAIVMPVFAAILGAIANAPLGQDGSLFLPGVMTPTTLTLIFAVALPIIFIFLVYYIKMIEPKM